LERKLNLIKLGGSVITDKKTPLQLNIKVINRIAKALIKINDPIMIIHGGGSFGHFYANKYNFDINPKKNSLEGVSKIKIAMAKLNFLLSVEFEKVGLLPFSTPPMCLFYNQKISSKAIKQLNLLLNQGFIPITYGDIEFCKDGFFIFSGDKIIRILAERLLPLRVLFVMDVDGIYDSNNSKKNILKEFNPKDNLKIIDKNHSIIDVTGGIKNKLEESRRIAELGINVYFVNGLKPLRITRLLQGKSALCTLIKGRC
jgi:isopentenyl phosphate kinase